MKNRKIKSSRAIGVIILCAFLAMYLIARATPEVVPDVLSFAQVVHDASQTYSVVDDQATTEWNNYTLPSEGISFWYPSDWEVDEGFSSSAYTVRAGNIQEDGAVAYFDIWLHTMVIDVQGSAPAQTKVDGRTAYELNRVGDCGEYAVCTERTILVTLDDGVRTVENGVELWKVEVAELRHGVYKEGVVGGEEDLALTQQNFKSLTPILNKMLSMVTLTQ